MLARWRPSPPRGLARPSGGCNAISAANGRHLTGVRGRQAPRRGTARLPRATPPQQQQEQQKPQQAQKQPAKQPGGGGGGGGSGDGDAPSGGPPELPPQLRRLLVLLVEYGGVYGTAASLLGYFLHIDPFGNFHAAADDALLGLRLYAPLLLFDALVMVPDYAPKEEQADAVNRIFFGPAAALRSALEKGGGGADAPAAGGGAAAAPVPEPSPLLRAQLSLELLQSFQTRANPTMGLSVWSEGAVAAVAALADEMLYRAVALTFLAGWLKDRFFEAGFDDDVALAGRTLPTSEFAQYSAMAVVAALGVAGFAAKAYQERRTVERMQILTSSGKADEKAEAIKAQLIASMGWQNQIIYAVEGVREVALGVASGLSFVWTGNLAAPYAGALIMQLLFSQYQRASLDRQRRRRREALARAQQRSAEVREAIAAAMKAKKARGGAEAAPAASDAGAAAPASDAAAGGAGVDEALSPAARVMLSELDVRRNGGGGGSPAAAALLEAERAADLAEIRAAVADPPAAAAAAAADDGAEAGAAAAAGAAASPSGGDDAAAARAAADERLSALLTSMLRSREGRGVVRRFRDASTAQQDGGAGSSGSGGGGGGGEGEEDVSAYIESLLSDPDTKARLISELEARLVEMGEGSDGEEGGGGSGGGGGAA
ncbi:hypothetical protein Rsub_02957 [Raphidocelis subcapitata]|uniref:Uncharacterized protein n=1 Tax=Raphidocelis subcapitata TaxID=307507 RepID=A0A2V0NXY5_9CHLO|nr:hypothetical protein Rsub_02957 [Raphidocelis subcapitata]|eukprot:GBF89787.1 hypothetical protein Rsub_02957 [Raphidocelis subcapitata]